MLSLSFYNTFELPVTIVRPFNTYGPRQSARAIIPTIISQIASGKKKIQIGEMTMFDNTNIYTLRTEITGGIAHYFVSFMDVQNIHHKIEVSHLVFLEFQRFIKTERNLRRWDERHIEQSDLTDEELYNRALYKPINFEEELLDSMRNKKLWLSIQNLSEIQRRRLIMHHEFGLTYEQIAKMENCSSISIFHSVKRAEGKIKSVMKL